MPTNWAPARIADLPNARSWATTARTVLVRGAQEDGRVRLTLELDPTNHRVFVAAAKFGPAPAGGRGRGPLLADSMSVLVIGK